MSPAADLARNQSSLRDRAVAKLTPTTRTDLSRSNTSQAMAVLFQLASSPDTAHDALALLHELQVHQVELELQAEELRQAHVELESALFRQTDRVERAPVGYLTIDATTTLQDINLTGARLLGATANDLVGRRLVSFLTTTHADKLQTLLDRARDGLSPETCQLSLVPAGREARDVYASADRASTPGQFLLVLMAAA
ncbi:MAG: PAS domain-containing protein [Burkholderiales bacterium]|nr:PAS domain-containing protein [Burkholderiales bacterium]